MPTSLPKRARLTNNEHSEVSAILVIVAAMLALLLAILEAQAVSGAAGQGVMPPDASLFAPI